MSTYLENSSTVGKQLKFPTKPIYYISATPYIQGGFLVYVRNVCYYLRYRFFLQILGPDPTHGPSMMDKKSQSF